MLPKKEINKLILNADFNNELMRGINSGLSLYDNLDMDLSLFKPVNTEKIKNINVDEINKKLADSESVTKTIENIGNWIGKG